MAKQQAHCEGKLKAGSYKLYEPAHQHTASAGDAGTQTPVQPYLPYTQGAPVGARPSTRRVAAPLVVQRKAPRPRCRNTTEHRELCVLGRRGIAGAAQEGAARRLFPPTCVGDAFGGVCTGLRSIR